ncbi:MAG: zinc metalloprotease HtpX [Gammaproteobacteria bacterium]|nr:zinc metalloprotease HtpX [Gammaproteobacteria bacterium]
MNRWQRHVLSNRLQSLALVALLLGIAATAGGLLLGETGLVAALVASVLALAVEPGAATRLTLALYRARPLAPGEAPPLERVAARLAAQVGLKRRPQLHWVPTPIINAFAVGSANDPHIVLTDGLLRELTLREITGVLAHEIAHIAQGDLRVMGLADYVSRLTNLFALLAQIVILMSLPAWIIGDVEVPWSGLLLLLVSPHIALLAQLSLSRVREYDADLTAAALTGDPEGLASALAKIERANRSWRAWLFPGWGNPEPSWLRTHPATEDRILRLLSLSTKKGSGEAFEPWTWTQRGTSYRPRWRLGGIWR